MREEERREEGEKFIFVQKTFHAKIIRTQTTGEDCGGGDGSVRKGVRKEGRKERRSRKEKGQQGRKDDDEMIPL